MKYKDLKGKEFNYISSDRISYRAFVAYIDYQRGITAKSLDVLIDVDNLICLNKEEFKGSLLSHAATYKEIFMYMCRCIRKGVYDVDERKKLYKENLRRLSPLSPRVFASCPSEDK